MVRADALSCVNTKTRTAAPSDCSFYQAGPAVSQQCLRKPGNCFTSIKNSASLAQRTQHQSKTKGDSSLNDYREGNSKRNEGASFSILF